MNLGRLPFKFQKRLIITRAFMESAGLLENSDKLQRKRRGVGYAEHKSGDSWDMTQHESKQTADSKALQQSLHLITTFLQRGENAEFDFSDPFNFVLPISDSCLRGVLVSLLSNDSFTDICKRSQLYLEVLHLVQVMMTWPCLHDFNTRLRAVLLKFARYLSSCLPLIYFARSIV